MSGGHRLVMLKRKTSRWAVPVKHHGPSGASCSAMHTKGHLVVLTAGVVWSTRFSNVDVGTLYITHFLNGASDHMWLGNSYSGKEIRIKCEGLLAAQHSLLTSDESCNID